MRSRQSLKAYAFFAGLLLVVAQSAYANYGIKTLGHSINLAGKQRMLSQKMSKLVAQVKLNLDTSSALKDLNKSATLFDKTLIGLKEGSSDLNLVPAKSRVVKNRIKKTMAVWKDFYSNIQKIVNNKAVSEDEFDVIADNNLSLLKTSNGIVQGLVIQSRGGTGESEGLAIAINLAGKQRMLSQKMTKEYLFVLAGYKPKEYKSSLKDSIALFDKTLKGLLNGDKDLRLAASPNEEVSSQLNKTRKLWKTFKTKVEKAYDPAKVTKADTDYVIQNNTRLLKESNKVVTMLTAMLPSGQFAARSESEMGPTPRT